MAGSRAAPSKPGDIKPPPGCSAEAQLPVSSGHEPSRNSLLSPRLLSSFLFSKIRPPILLQSLIVRGICCLRPGIPGISENITVRSIVGRFLEHSRIYYFHNAGEEIIYMGSADLMPRNLNQRVEVLFPVEDPQMIRTIRDEILETYLKDNVKARIMQPDGSYKRLKPQPGEPIINAQETFIARRREAQGEHG
ncbi:hypothetical protein [Anaerolinea thermophila]|uniref:hypothetical protein n=1 Tax=Anaerolinea thermophila TaxID=167964 RepID=UPI0012DC06BA|nr:hypothetical protein [Anaerolinea thermophila]